MRKLLLVLLISLSATSVFAQDREDPAAQARFHFGRIALTPIFSLTNAGVDNNVFNEPNSESPKSDFTMTAQAKADAWMHARRSLISFGISEDFVYYKKYSNQRSVNGTYRIGLLVPLTRLRFKTDAALTHAKDRPGFEIDARLPRTDTVVGGSVEWRATAKTFLGIRANRQRTSFDENSVFAGANIRTELTRTVTSQALTLENQLTPLTTITIDAGRQQDRFEFNPLRDADSTNLVLGALFNKFALLKGTAKLGLRRFVPSVSTLPSYTGPTANFDLTYVARGVTRFNVTMARDVAYSFDVNQPYYLLTGGSVSVSQQIHGNFDLTGRGGRQNLAYRDRVGATITKTDRTDTVRSYLVSLGYRLGKTLRLGLNLDNQHRTSALASRTYDNTRFGIGLTYEF